MRGHGGHDRGVDVPGDDDLNSIVPGAIVPGKRASWVLQDATIYDTSSHKFLVPGSFFP